MPSRQGVDKAGETPAQHRARVGRRHRGRVDRGRQGRRLPRPSEAHVRHRLTRWPRPTGDGPTPGSRSSRSTRPTTSPGSSPSLPGEFPFTRGPYRDMYRGRPWTMRQYAGLRLRRGDERALPLPARAGPDRPLGRLRPADPARLRLRRPARRGEVGQLRRLDRLARRHGACSSTASRSTRSPPR